MMPFLPCASIQKSYVCLWKADAQCAATQHSLSL